MTVAVQSNDLHKGRLPLLEGVDDWKKQERTEATFRFKI